jgi:lantibiotic modifying enzyme
MDLYEQAVNMALETARRKDYTVTDISDGGICNGFAGVAHIYNRFYHYTKIEAFRDTSLFWAQKLLKYLDFVGGIEVYKEYDPKGNEYKISQGLLTGSAGIGLSLISILEPNLESRWDRFLLIS